MNNLKTPQNTPLKIPETEWIFQDDHYGIMVSNDSNRGVAVQVVMFKEQKMRLSDGTIVVGEKTPHTIFQEIVSTRSNHQLIAPAQFHKLVQEAVLKAKRFLTEEQQSSEMCQGAMLTVISQHKK